MSILGWIILGGIAGWIASHLTGNREGCLMDIVIGICGALIGGFIFSLLGRAPATHFNLGSLFVAVIGAVVLLLIVRAVRRNPAP
jgi:uncharacterized membrane protein YeaQ/YmgE (transglycosylase-associated protein family)